MRRYLEAADFVHEDTTDFTSAPEDEYVTAGILLAGEIGCRGRIVIAVRKFLEIVEPSDGDAVVETRIYRYNVSIRGSGNIFRYDNGHPHTLYPDHHDPHHKHLFDWQTGEELPDSPVWVGRDRWPHLSGVIDEARDWYLSNRSALPDPDAFPELNLRD
jgi:hypothetical protein